MRAFCAYPAFAGLFKPWFEDFGVIRSPDDIPEMDLLILTGGEDIDPGRYNSPNQGSGGINLARDEHEFSVLRNALEINKQQKVLAVCRGLQLVNVFLGGDLIQDIYSIGKDHNSSHKMSVREYCRGNWPKSVNSLHHQAIASLGISIGYHPAVMGTEPNTGLIEMINWSNKIFATQFHPEMFIEEKAKPFFSQVKDWVNGDLELTKKQSIILDPDMHNSTISVDEYSPPQDANFGSASLVWELTAQPEPEEESNELD